MTQAELAEAAGLHALATAGPRGQGGVTAAPRVRVGLAGSARPSSGASLGRIAEDLADALADLVGTGHPLPECYLDGALMSLRIATGALLRSVDHPDLLRADGSLRVVLANGAPTGAMVTSAPDMVWDVTMPATPRPPQNCGEPDLGAALLLDAEARAVARCDVGAAFLRDTLIGHRWTHAGSCTAWWVGATAASSLLAALRGGRGAPALSHALAGRSPERRALSLIARLGWSVDQDLVPPPFGP